MSLFEKALAHRSRVRGGMGRTGRRVPAQGDVPQPAGTAGEGDRACETRALALDPDLAEAHTWLGAALLSLGRVDAGASRRCEQARRSIPSRRVRGRMLARAYWIGRGDLHRGIAELERAVAINPQFGYGHLQLAFLYTEQRRVRQGRSAAAQRRRRSPGAVHFRRRRAARRGRAHAAGLRALPRGATTTEARAGIPARARLPRGRRSRAQGPCADRAAPEAGRGLSQAGSAAEAERHLNLAIRSFEDRRARGADDPATKYYAAIALALHGDTDRAMKYLEETWPRAGALNRFRAARDPDLESVRPLLAAKGLLG